MLLAIAIGIPKRRSELNTTLVLDAASLQCHNINGYISANVKKS
jgi:hypothetical protein